jgi:hypothetical protein
MQRSKWHRSQGPHFGRVPRRIPKPNRRRAWPMVLALMTALGIGTATASTALGYTSQVYLYSGHEQLWSPPVSGTAYALRVIVVGARGGDGGTGGSDPGGGSDDVAPMVTGYLYWAAAAPHPPLFVEVGGTGGNGKPCSGFSGDGAGGWNGGGESYGCNQENTVGSGGGGGASDVRTVSCGNPCNTLSSSSLSSRLLVAGGDGGGGGAAGNYAGGYGGTGVPNGGEGGAGAENLSDGVVGGPGGFPGSTGSGGSDVCELPGPVFGSGGGGAPGAGGVGGTGPSDGGGGGGGEFGGGGGAAGCNSNNANADWGGGGGGGGGSSHGPGVDAYGLTTSYTLAKYASEVEIENLVAPTATISYPSDGVTYAQGTVINTQFSCTDASGSPGIASCRDSNGNQGSSGQIDMSASGSYSYTVTATSKDQLTVSQTIHYTVAGPPSARITAPAAGGSYKLRQSVPTSFNCAPGVDDPGLAECIDSNNASAPHGKLDTATAGRHTYIVTAYSTDGLSSSTSITYMVTASSGSGASKRPSASHPLIFAIAKGQPRLSFTVAAAAGGPPLRVLKINPKGGLSFATAHRDLSDDIVVRTAGKEVKFTATVRDGALEVALARAQPSVGITIAYPELSATKSLSNEVKRSTGKHPVTLTLALAVATADHKVTTLALKLDL